MNFTIQITFFFLLCPHPSPLKLDSNLKPCTVHPKPNHLNDGTRWCLMLDVSPRHRRRPSTSTTHQPADLLLSVWCGASCGFDHSGGLIISQLLDASLTCYNVTHLEGVNAESLGCKHASPNSTHFIDFFQKGQTL